MEVFGDAATTISTSDWTHIASALGSAGFSVFIAWYLITKAGPKILTDFLAELKENREAAQVRETRLREESLAREAALWQAALARENNLRANAKEDMSAVLAHCERESQRNNEIMKVEFGAITGAIRQTGEVIENVRDVLVRIDAYGQQTMRLWRQAAESDPPEGGKNNDPKPKGTR